ncbi:hypothetical protein MMC13_001098 [Lambiella insularis]|nr:hypothetical protein [Lambiella insularis]
MSRVVAKLIDELGTWMKMSSGRMKKMFSGEGTPGTRAAPTQTPKNDANFGLRIDHGEKFNKGGKVFQRFNVQANKNAKNSTIRAMANKNSHQILTYADVLVNEEAAGGHDDSKPLDEMTTELLEEFKKNLED